MESTGAVKVQKQECLRNQYDSVISLAKLYLDDGMLAGSKHAVLRALSIIEDLSPTLETLPVAEYYKLLGHCRTTSIN
ncbi:hypothetical protein EMCRGX_G020516 [Ephydatia muelleri]